ncbi:hypothetical protein ACH5RR_008124 [Cinchona calisaya]|uniref:Glycosyl transferase family 1 domain-containing protein n=1 Tax=Cinchona calisaya TaxID=153742 RepID=A0ABD3ADE3_9GENT
MALLQKQKVKILIGSLGSKRNKVTCVKSLLEFLCRHTNLSKSVLWTPATSRIASLCAAADVYAVNSQVLGTYAGGTKEIVEHNVTGFLHPLGHPGAQVLAKDTRSRCFADKIGRLIEE